MSFKAVIIFLVYWSSHCKTTEACSCGDWSRERLFCYSTFSVRGIPIQEVRFKFGGFIDMLNYTIHVITQFKPAEGYPARQIFVQTPMEESLCGIRLQVGEEYILNGYGEYSKEVGLCGWNEHWSVVSSHLKYKLANNEMNCI